MDSSCREPWRAASRNPEPRRPYGQWQVPQNIHLKHGHRPKQGFLNSAEGGRAGIPVWADAFLGPVRGLSLLPSVSVWGELSHRVGWARPRAPVVSRVARTCT